MRFDILTLEVDGSLANPIVLRAVLLWGAVLGLVTAVAVRWWKNGGGEREQGRARAVIVTLALLFLYGSTPVAQAVLGHALYQLDFVGSGRQLTSVGFWGGPPVLPACVMGVTCGAIAAIALRRPVPMCK